MREEARPRSPWATHIELCVSHTAARARDLPFLDRSHRCRNAHSPTGLCGSRTHENPDAKVLGGSVRSRHTTLNAPGLPAIDGVVDYVSAEFLGVRSSDALYRFIHGLGGTVVLGHHIFADVDRRETEQAWQSWVDRAFA